MNLSIGIGIVNYNGGSYLRECVLSALALKGDGISVYVYDNASTDDSLESLAGLDNVTIIRGDINHGYAFACNRLIEAMSFDLVVVANMDLSFDPHWAQEIRKAFDLNAGIDSVASFVIEQGDPQTVNFAGIGFFPDLHAQSTYAGAKPSSVSMIAKPIFGAYGAVMVFRRSLFDAIGCFDEDYFLFYEETEFFWRMGIFDRKVLFWPQATIVHARSLTTRRFSPLKLFYTERNRVYTGLKILPLRYYPGLFFWSIYRLVRMRCAVDAGQKEKMASTGATPVKIITTILSAWVAALILLPVIYRKRAALWRQSGASAEKTVQILTKHLLPWSALSLK